MCLKKLLMLLSLPPVPFLPMSCHFQECDPIEKYAAADMQQCCQAGQTGLCSCRHGCELGKNWGVARIGKYVFHLPGAEKWQEIATSFASDLFLE